MIGQAHDEAALTVNLPRGWGVSGYHVYPYLSDKAGLSKPSQMIGQAPDEAALTVTLPRGWGVKWLSCLPLIFRQGRPE